MPRCPERPCAPCASRGLGLQGPPPPTTHRGPPAPGRAPEISEGRPRPRAGSPRPRRQAPPPAGPHSGRRAGAGGPASFGSQLRPRVARALSRRSWPDPGCSHGKAHGRGAGPGRSGPAAPGGSAGTRGSAALAVRGGRCCLRLRAQADTAGGRRYVAASKFRPQIRAATERAPNPGVLPVFLDRGLGRCWAEVAGWGGASRDAQVGLGRARLRQAELRVPRPCLGQLLPG